MLTQFVHVIWLHSARELFHDLIIIETPISIFSSICKRFQLSTNAQCVGMHR